MITELTLCNDLLVKETFPVRVYSILFTQPIAELKTNKTYCLMLSDLVGRSHCAFSQNAFISLITKLNTVSDTKINTNH